MLLHALRHAPSANFTYLIADGAHGAVIDPSFQGQGVLRKAAQLGLTIDVVLLTHDHTDHCADLERVALASGCRVGAHPSSRIRKDIALEDGATVRVGELAIRVIHTPGHTPDSVCLLADGCLFTGDTLFVGECGRTDLPGGDAAALYDSLFRVLGALDDKLGVYPGHDYGSQPHSTLGQERRTSYVLRPRTLEDFVRFMAEP